LVDKTRLYTNSTRNIYFATGTVAAAFDNVVDGLNSFAMGRGAMMEIADAS